MSWLPVAHLWKVSEIRYHLHTHVILFISPHEWSIPHLNLPDGAVQKWSISHSFWTNGKENVCPPINYKTNWLYCQDLLDEPKRHTFVEIAAEASNQAYIDKHMQTQEQVTQASLFMKPELTHHTFPHSLILCSNHSFISLPSLLVDQARWRESEHVEQHRGTLAWTWDNHQH